jgi:flagella basal body P-ring formation protein FlgA
MAKPVLPIFLSLFVVFAPATRAAEESCQITTANKIYHFGSESAGQPAPFHQSTCPHEVNQAFSELIFNGNGSLRAERIQQLLQTSYQGAVNIQPTSLNVFNLSNDLKTQFNLEANFHFRQLSSLDRRPLLFDEDAWVEFNCTSCQRTGEHTIQLTVRNSSSNQTTNRFVKGFVRAETAALVARSNLRVTNQGASGMEFELTTIETDRPENLFTDLSKLPFYRLNRPLNQGAPLQFSDLTPAPLVQPGTPAQVILNNGGLSLKTSAQPLRAGRYGETIQLRHPTTQKTLSGRVIDFNKVEVN